MQQLLGENRLEEQIFKQLFLQRLPMNAQLILASTADRVSLDELAALADKILEVALPTPSIAAFQSVLPKPTEDNSAAKEIAELRGQINQLTSQMQALTEHFQHQPPFRGRSRSRLQSPFRRNSYSRSRSQGCQPDDPTGAYCWYHYNFGARARSCDAPCTFAGNPSASPQQQQQQQQQRQQQNQQQQHASQSQHPENFQARN